MIFAPWRYLDGGLEDGAFNMAADQALLILCNEGKSPPTLRLYGWRKPTVSIGYSTKEFEKIDREYCEKKGIEIIRRPTGGRVLLHASEVTYSLVAPFDQGFFPKGLSKTHYLISETIVICLQKLGIRGEVISLSRGEDRDGSFNSPACFGLPNRAEVKVNGKKIVGSAQRRLNRAFLQHGSVLIHFEPEELNKIFLFADYKAKQSHLINLRERATCLYEQGVQTLEFKELKNLFFEGFCETLTVNAKEGAWTDDENHLFNQIRQELPVNIE